MVISSSIFMYYAFICIGFVSLLIGGSFFGVFQTPESEKNSVYECGFNPFADARCKFEVRFYVVGLLFLIFDLELMFLFPWILIWIQLFPIGLFAMMLFLFLLLLGFLYEIAIGCLDWR